MKYFSECGRFHEAAQFFQPLVAEDQEVGSLLAKSYFSSGYTTNRPRIEGSQGHV